MVYCDSGVSTCKICNDNRSVCDYSRINVRCIVNDKNNKKKQDQKPFRKNVRITLKKWDRTRVIMLLSS